MGWGTKGCRFASGVVLALAGIAVSPASRADTARASISIYDASMSLLESPDQLLGVLLLRDGQVNPDIELAGRLVGHSLVPPEAIRLNENLNRVLEFYALFFGRSSYDGSQAEIHATVNVGRYFDRAGMYENAAWLPNQRVFLFGQGGAELGSFADSLEVVGHEFTHAVLSATSKLGSDGETGALSESLADVFGVIIRHFYLPDHPHPFRIGDGVLRGRAAAQAAALRDLEDPHRSLGGQPAKLSEVDARYAPGCVASAANDRCGAHLNDGVPNRAAALIIQALGWDAAARLFYSAMTTRLGEDADFSRYRRALLAECAATLPGERCAQVAAAFDSVEIR